MTTFLRRIACAGLCLSALLGWAGVVAAQQAPAQSTASVARIRGEVTKAPALRVEPGEPLEVPTVTFKARSQRPFVPTLEEHLHKTFDLNLLQRQSADWAARCCGYNLGALVQHAETALRNRKLRKTREQIARELAALASRAPAVREPD